MCVTTLTGLNGCVTWTIIVGLVYCFKFGPHTKWDTLSLSPIYTYAALGGESLIFSRFSPSLYIFSVSHPPSFSHFSKPRRRRRRRRGIKGEKEDGRLKACSPLKIEALRSILKKARRRQSSLSFSNSNPSFGIYWSSWFLKN